MGFYSFNSEREFSDRIGRERTWLLGSVSKMIGGEAKNGFRIQLMKDKYVDTIKMKLSMRDTEVQRAWIEFLAQELAQRLSYIRDFEESVQDYNRAYI